MKIISRGVPPADKVYRGQCHNCNTVAEAKASELTIHPATQRDSAWAITNCPVCDKNMVFYEKGAL